MTQQLTDGPHPRSRHKTCVIGNNLYMWAGLCGSLNEDDPSEHDSRRKRKIASFVDIFDLKSGNWRQKPTSGTPPLGIGGYACAAVDDELHYFGGYCGHSGCYHNSVHKLSTTLLEWAMLYPTTSEDGAPMKKAFCDMVKFKDGEENILFVVGGFGCTSISHHQPGVQYERFYNDMFRCNEQHIFTLSKKEWSSPNVIGNPPPACDDFTLALIDERKAALFGGENRSGFFSDLLIVELLSRDTVYWSKLGNSVARSVSWPAKRQGHAACVLSGPLLVIMGGKNGEGIICDGWLYDFTKSDDKLWKKLLLPDSVTKRIWHSVSSLQLSSRCMLLIVFGGRLSPDDHDTSRLSNMAIIELIRRENCGWGVGKIIEGKDLVNSRTYQEMLSVCRRKQSWSLTDKSGIDGCQLEENKQENTKEILSEVMKVHEQVIHAYDASLSTSKEREQQLQSQLATLEQESQQQLLQLEDEIHDLHKKIGVLEDQNEQQQEELKRLQQKGEARLAAVCNKEQQRLPQHQRRIFARDVQNSQLQNENKLAQDKSYEEPEDQDEECVDEITQQTLTSDDLLEVLEQLSNLTVSKYRRLGLKLGLKPSTLSNLESDDDFGWHIMEAWLNQVDNVKNPTWKCLIAALQSQYVGQNVTAQRVRQWLTSR